MSHPIANVVLFLTSAVPWTRLEPRQLEPRQEENTREPGLPVGRAAPAFTLEDQRGRELSLGVLLEKGPVALVFFRSARCMYCKLQLIQLQRDLAEIEGAGGQVVGICNDPAEALGAFAGRNSITFPLLSDVNSATIDAYDFRSRAQGANGVSYHGTFIVDRRGIIHSKLFQVSYRERPAMDALLRALRAAREPARSVRGEPAALPRTEPGLGSDRRCHCACGSAGVRGRDSLPLRTRGARGDRDRDAAEGAGGS